MRGLHWAGPHALLGRGSGGGAAAVGVLESSGKAWLSSASSPLFNLVCRLRNGLQGHREGEAHWAACPRAPSRQISCSGRPANPGTVADEVEGSVGVSSPPSERRLLPPAARASLLWCPPPAYAIWPRCRLIRRSTGRTQRHGKGAQAATACSSTLGASHAGLATPAQCANAPELLPSVVKQNNAGPAPPACQVSGQSRTCCHGGRAHQAPQRPAAAGAQGHPLPAVSGAEGPLLLIGQRAQHATCAQHAQHAQHARCRAKRAQHAQGSRGARLGTVGCVAAAPLAPASALCLRWRRTACGQRCGCCCGRRCCCCRCRCSATTINQQSVPAASPPGLRRWCWRAPSRTSACRRWRTCCASCTTQVLRGPAPCPPAAVQRRPCSPLLLLLLLLLRCACSGSACPPLPCSLPLHLPLPPLLLRPRGLRAGKPESRRGAAAGRGAAGARAGRPKAAGRVQHRPGQPHAAAGGRAAVAAAGGGVPAARGLGGGREVSQQDT